MTTTTFLLQGTLQVLATTTLQTSTLSGAAAPVTKGMAKPTQFHQSALGQLLLPHNGLHCCLEFLVQQVIKARQSLQSQTQWQVILFLLMLHYQPISPPYSTTD